MKSHRLDLIFRTAVRILYGLSLLADRPIIVSGCIMDQTFIGFEETSSFWSVQLFSDFHWSPSIGKPRITSVSVKTTE